MSMKVKPGITYRGNRLDNTLYHPEETERLIKSAVNKISPRAGVMLELESVSKNKKRTPVAKAKSVKTKISQNKPTIPMLVDEERHALWWDLKKDRTFMSVPYPIRPQDKAEGIKKTLNSQASRKVSLRLVDLGKAPHNKVDDPSKIGSVCHEASAEFKAVVDRNMDYVKELSSRVCVDVSIGSAFLSLRDRKESGATPLIAFNAVDKAIALAMETQFIDNSFAIDVLEQQLSAKPEPSDRLSQRHERVEKRYWDEKMDELGLALPLTKVAEVDTPSANDSVYSTEDQRVLACDHFEKVKQNLSSLRGTQEARYAVSLKRLEGRTYFDTHLINRVYL